MSYQSCGRVPLQQEGEGICDAAGCLAWGPKSGEWTGRQSHPVSPRTPESTTARTETPALGLRRLSPGSLSHRGLGRLPLSAWPGEQGSVSTSQLGPGHPGPRGSRLTWTEKPAGMGRPPNGAAGGNPFLGPAREEPLRRQGPSHREAWGSSATTPRGGWLPRPGECPPSSTNQMEKVYDGIIGLLKKKKKGEAMVRLASTMLYVASKLQILCWRGTPDWAKASRETRSIP